ncbi:Glycosyl hydrolase family 65 central catalytic domain [Leishmania shawi]|uniref:Glycosyl hydrolase family 65 central catalytic domain n=1 Tax=Leishmania shawi TaxID=5680 RepID=A0AAW3BYQ7_9TRYP
MNPLLARDYEVPKKPIFRLEGRTVVQSTEASAFMPNSITDSVMYSTNGHLGLRHLSEVERVGFKTEVLMNGIYHEEPTDTWEFKGIPRTNQVGASICTVDFDCMLDGESGTLSSIPHRELNLDDGAYRSKCSDVMSADNGVIFDTNYMRTVALSDLSAWGAQVCYTDFRLSDIGSPVSVGSVSNAGLDNGVMSSSAPHSFSMDSMSDRAQQTHQSLTIDRPQESLNYRIELVVLISINQECWDVVHEGMDRICQSSLTSDSAVTTFTEVSCVVNYGDRYNLLQAEVQSTPWARDPESDTTSPFLRDLYNVNASGSRDGPSSYSNKEGKVHGRSDRHGRDTSAFRRPDTWNYHAFHSPNKAQRSYVIKKRFMLTLTPERVPDSVVLTFRACHKRAVTEQRLRALPTVEEMIADQRAALELFWKTFEADVKLQDDLSPSRSSLPFVYNAFRMFMVSHGLEGGLSRSGLSAAGDGLLFNLSEYIYYGLYYLLTQPEACLLLLKSVYHMLPQSRKYARVLAMNRGAVFPLKTISGVHSTHPANVSNARFHVNAEIGFLIALYDDASENIPAEDRLLLLELMMESARIWPQCGEWQDDHTVFRLDNIAGTDEYNSNASGNFYVNISARRHISSAFSFLDRQQGHLTEEQLNSVFASLGMTRHEMAELQAVGNGIVVPQRHERLGVYMVHDNFDTLLDWGNDRARHPLHLNYHPIHIYRRKLIDVPEVLLGMLLYPDEFDQRDFRQNFEYYLPLCTFDSPESLFVMVHALCRARSSFSQPMPLLRSLANIDLDNIVYSAEGGLHFSAIATTLPGLIFGCGGVRLSHKGLQVNPILPARVERYSFTIKWRGAVLRVLVDYVNITYDLLSGASLRFIHGARGERIHLHTGFGHCPEITHLAIPRTRLSQVAQFDGVVLLSDCLFDNLLEYSYRSWYKTLETLFDTYRVLHNRPIPPLTPEEFIEKVVYQCEDGEISFSGIGHILQRRGVHLELGTPEDAEIVETRYGLANAKVAEMTEMVLMTPPPVNPGLFSLLKCLVENGVALAVVSYSRTLKQLLASNPQLTRLFVASIDGEEAHDWKIKGQPHLDLYIRAAEKIHVDTSRCLVISHHLDRGFNAKEMSRFRMFIDVEDPFVSSRFPSSPYPTLTPEESQETGRYNPVVCRLKLSQIPSTIDELEDLVDGRSV